MGVDAEKVLVSLCRFLHFFMNTSKRCVEKHPFISSILLLSFIVYIFFNFLIYSLPFLVFIAIFLKFFWSSGHPTIVQNAKETETRIGRMSNANSGSVKEDHVVHRNIENPSFQTQKSRRRNFTDENRLLDAQADKEENKDMFPSATPNDNLTGKTASNDRNQKVDEEEKDSSLERGQKSAANALAADNVQVDANLPATYSELEVEEVDDDDEEEPNEDGNHAMEWTADDEKNLMDLGLSEIERNKRLESLIAKRRARKVFKLHVEKALSGMHGGLSHVAPILIAKNDPVNAPGNSSGIDGLQIPGSAPSVLLPTQNPFDLPYDPHEEKPDLTADSFYQEFTEAHQKEMLFCRHESFSLGPSFPFEHKQDKNDSKLNSFIGVDKKALDGLGYSRFRRQSDKLNHDQLIERIMSKPYDRKPHVDNTPVVIEKESNFPTQVMASKDEENADYRTNMIGNQDKTMMESDNPMDSMFARSEVHVEPQVTVDGNDESPSPSSSPTSSSSSSSSNQITPSIFNPSRAGIPKPTLGYAAHNNQLGLSVPRSIAPREPFYDSSLNCSPTSNHKSKMEERLIYAVRPCHTSTYSIASDMQVEVSDCGSPPTGNENNSPTDTESLTNFGEIEKSISNDHKTFDYPGQGKEHVWNTQDSPRSDALLPETPENSMQLSEKLETHPADEVFLPRKTEEPPNHPDESTEENNNIIFEEKASVVSTIDNKEDIKEDEDEDKDSEVQMLSQKEIAGEQPKPAEQTTNLTADLQAMESVQPNVDNKNLNTIDDSEMPQTLDQQEIAGELPNPSQEVKLDRIMSNEDSSESKDQSKDMVEPNEDVKSMNLIRGDSEELNEPEDGIRDMSKTIEAEAQVLTQQENAEELSKTSKETELEANIASDFKYENPVDHQALECVQSNENIENLSVIGDTVKLAEQEEGGLTDMSNTIETHENLLSSENSKADHQPLEPVQPNEDTENLRVIEDIEKLAEQEEGGLTDTSNPIEIHENLLSSEDSKDEQSSVEIEESHANQSSDEPTSTTVMEQEPPVELVPVNSSPSSSPTSVLTKHIAVGEMSSASLNEMVQIDVPQSDTEAIGRSSSSGELPLDNEPSNPPENFTDEFNIIGSTTEPLIGEPESDNKATEGDLATLLNPEAVAEFSKEDLETHTTSIAKATGILEGGIQEETISKPSEDKQKLKSVEESGSQPAADAQVNLEAMKEGGEDVNTVE